jgi:hypothetical protein
MDLIIPPLPVEPAPAPSNPTELQTKEYNQALAAYNYRVAIINYARVAPQQLANAEAQAKAQADTAVALTASVAAQQQTAAAIALPPPAMTDEDRAFDLVVALAKSGVVGIAAVSKARETMAAFRFYYPRSSP